METTAAGFFLSCLFKIEKSGLARAGGNAAGDGAVRRTLQGARCWVRAALPVLGLKIAGRGPAGVKRVSSLLRSRARVKAVERAENMSQSGAFS